VHVDNSLMNPLHTSPILTSAHEKLWRTRFVHTTREQMLELAAFTQKYNIMRWALCGAIGCVTALIAFFIDFIVNKTASMKFGKITNHLENCMYNSSIVGDHSNS
jgi:hypothetical protein